jgi:signal transduction histidine kinase
MFGHARRRLAIRYAAISAVVLAVFSLAFLGGLAVILRPDFDIGPEVAAPQSAREANADLLARVGLAVVVADAAAVLIIGFAGFYLAGRTLRPIRDAHERQGRFVADASHEIRTPLAVIRANVGRALAASADADTRTDALEAIDRAATRLGDVASDLLVLARLEANPAESAPMSIDASVVVAEVVESTQDAHPGLAERVRMVLAPDVSVAAEETDLARIVQNFLDNAIAYGAAGTIDVRTGIHGGQAMVEVCDQGPGIAPEDLARIFEPFYRVRSDANAPHGSGLGLAIAQRLAASLGGTIRVRTAPGQGACFRLLLPRDR